MRAVLEWVDLGHLVGRHARSMTVDWQRELSLGEQQRLGMVRGERGIRVCVCVDMGCLD